LRGRAAVGIATQAEVYKIAERLRKHFPYREEKRWRKRERKKKKEQREEEI